MNISRYARLSLPKGPQVCGQRERCAIFTLLRAFFVWFAFAD